MNVRTRLPNQKRVLEAVASSEENLNSQWKYCGYRSVLPRHSFSSNVSKIKSLKTTDIQMTYNYDLLQHEKLLSILRKLIKSLYDAQSMLSRNFDSVMRHHLNCCRNGNELGIDERNRHIVDASFYCHESFSRELFRKQQIVEEIVDSSDIFDIDILLLATKSWSIKNKHQSFINADTLEKYGIEVP